MATQDQDGSDPQEAEFDVVARWTADAIESLGRDHAVPGACQGTGGPAALRWLVDRLGLRSGEVLLDVGAGTGGPAAFAQQEAKVEPLLVDLQQQACLAAGRLFDLPSVRASADHLPVAGQSVPVAWCLGTICTTDHHAEVVSELARVLQPGGRLGLMVLVATGDQTLRASTGNAFPTAPDLLGLLEASGLVVAHRAWGDQLSDPDPAWRRRAAEVESLVARRHRGEPAHETASRQGAVLADLLDRGAVRRLFAVATKEP